MINTTITGWRGRLAAVLASAINAADATVYPLPPDNSCLIGENTTHTVMQDGGSLEAIAGKYKIGLLAMLEANPGTDPWLPRPGTVLTIPSQMLLPECRARASLSTSPNYGSITTRKGKTR